MVKFSYEQLGNPCGLLGAVESESALVESFFRAEIIGLPDSSGATGPAVHPAVATERLAHGRTKADPSLRPPFGSDDNRDAIIALYDGTQVAPRVETVKFVEPTTYIDVLSLAVMNCVSELGGNLTPEIAYELVSNLVHASFSRPVISILDGGNTLRVADSGPGIPNKSAALRPGFTSANATDRAVVRGVGAGLPLVRSLVEPLGGFLVIDDNIGGGTVVTASVATQSPNRYSPIEPTVSLRERAPEVPAPERSLRAVAGAPDEIASRTASALNHEDGRTAGEPAGSGVSGHLNPLVTSPSSTVRGVPLSDRQLEVLAVVAESLEAGPSTVSTLLDIPLSTAYRDLRFLEERGLVSTLGGGKRQVTGMGLELLKVV